MSSSSSTTSTPRGGAFSIGGLSILHTPVDDEVMQRLTFPAVVVAALAAVLWTGSSVQALRLPAARRCVVFPASNPGNQRVDQLPVACVAVLISVAIGLDS